MMKLLLGLTLISLVAAPAVGRGCETGLYRSPDGKESVAVTDLPDGSLRYTLDDGIRGIVGQPGALLSCIGEEIRTTAAKGSAAQWQRVPLKMRQTQFQSHGTTLSGVLIDPPAPRPHPLVVFVHGSERYSPLKLYYPYLFASYGISVFAYDKRGTGQSEGEYTQNFELLADDASAALREARRLDQGRFTKAGFFGGSQGGWVAPLAATRSPADFVAVGFGLISSPIEEDRDQVADDLREKGFGQGDIAEALELASAASAIAASHFTRGFEQFDALKRKYSSRRWYPYIKGEYTGAMLKESDADLRRVGQPLFDNVELIWNYDAPAVIRKLKVPLLWIFAERDREAPPAITLKRLSELKRRGADVVIYSFPHTDHGIYEFQQAADGSRTVTRIASGYFPLLTDWIKGTALKDHYGTARRHRGVR
jgi:pimeloyl-ACP methyl ester carboxylesterase